MVRLKLKKFPVCLSSEKKKKLFSKLKSQGVV